MSLAAPTRRGSRLPASAGVESVPGLVPAWRCLPVGACVESVPGFVPAGTVEHATIVAGDAPQVTPRGEEGEATASGVDQPQRDIPWRRTSTAILAEGWLLGFQQVASGCRGGLLVLGCGRN
ncbi:hypothetical protein ACP70R_025957 [Stipagrostis hirtigluma subsp. patula]